MSLTLQEYLTAQFYIWEERGRGHLVSDGPVHLEPEFVPFFGHIPPQPKVIDDGVRPRFFPVLQEQLGLLKKKSVSYEEDFEKVKEAYETRPFIFDDDSPLVEYEINFGHDTSVAFERADQFLLMLSQCTSILSFEIIGNAQSIRVQLVCRAVDGQVLTGLATTYLPGVVLVKKENGLLDSFQNELPIYVHDYALSEEFMRPLKVWNRFDPDPLAGIVGVLESLQQGEAGMLQVLFQGAINPWAESIIHSVSDGQGGSFFEDSPEMPKLAQEKVAYPLFAVVVRTVGQGETAGRSYHIAELLGKRLVSVKNPGSNSLVELSNEGYPPQRHVDDVLLRQSQRLGMLLNSGELTALVHVPDASVSSNKLRQYHTKTKAAPESVLNQEFTLGVNHHLGKEQEVSLSTQQRLRHTHLIGATGTGKSSLLLRLIVQDMQMNQGLTLLDPHGDLVDNVVRNIPDKRLNDVALIDPSDTEFPIGLNLLSAHSDSEKVLLSSDLTALFKRFATSWGDQMTSVLGNAINALLEHPNGGTLIDLKRILVEKKFREQYLSKIEDPSVRYYWKHEFPMLRSNAISPILTRLDTFLRPKIVRNMMAQKEGLDFHDIINSNKILLVKLAQGLIGEDNSYLLGSLIVAKLHQAAQARQLLKESERTPYYLYIDEFQHFITPSMAAILSGSRKYGLGLVLAHQDLEQLFAKDRELANSVISNPAIRIGFRCGDFDARKLENGFEYFDATDLQSLSVGQAVARVGQRDHDFNFTFELLPRVDESTGKLRASRVVQLARDRYAKCRAQIEEVLHETMVTESKGIKEEEVVQPKVEEDESPKEVSKPVIAIEEQSQKYIREEREREEVREHVYLQTFVKGIAEARGFKAEVEKQTPDSKGRVDVSLVRDELTIAVEISVTNTVQYEIDNILKCLRAQFQMVIVLSKDEAHLRNIQRTARGHLNDDQLKHVSFINPEQFASYLDSILPSNTTRETRTQGYRVKTTVGKSQKVDEKLAAIRETITESIKRKSK